MYIHPIDFDLIKLNQRYVMRNKLLPDLDRKTVEVAYARWAPVYDRLCGPIFAPARHSATTAALQVGGRILEIGVGTGLLFGDYDCSTEIIGIDLSAADVGQGTQAIGG